MPAGRCAEGMWRVLALGLGLQLLLPEGRGSVADRRIAVGALVDLVPKVEVAVPERQHEHGARDELCHQLHRGGEHAHDTRRVGDGARDRTASGECSGEHPLVEVRHRLDEAADCDGHGVVIVGRGLNVCLQRQQALAEGSAVPRSDGAERRLVVQSCEGHLAHDDAELSVAIRRRPLVVGDGQLLVGVGRAPASLRLCWPWIGAHVLQQQEMVKHRSGARPA